MYIYIYIYVYIHVLEVSNILVFKFNIDMKRWFPMTNIPHDGLKSPSKCSVSIEYGDHTGRTQPDFYSHDPLGSAVKFFRAQNLTQLVPGPTRSKGFFLRAYTPQIWPEIWYSSSTLGWNLDWLDTGYPQFQMSGSSRSLIQDCLGRQKRRRFQRTGTLGWQRTDMDLFHRAAFGADETAEIAIQVDLGLVHAVRW